MTLTRDGKFFFFSFFFASVNVPVVSVKRGVSRGSNPGVGVESLS